MKPHEILEELDRLGITVWWDESSSHLKYVPSPTIRVASDAPAELRAAIKEHNEELLKIVRRQRSRQAPGIYYRKPRRAGGGEDA